MRSMMKRTAATHKQTAPARAPEQLASNTAAEAGTNSSLGYAADAWSYQRDLWQRSVLFLDILRERANDMLDHEQAGLPLLLVFPCEMILDARSFDKPANYALLRITTTGADRQAADAANPFLQAERSAGRQASSGLDLWRLAADACNERIFALLYGPLPVIGASNRSGK